MNGVQKRVGRILTTALLIAALLPAGLADARQDSGSVRGAVHNGNEVTVTLPDFDITLNNMEFDNRHAQYPLLVYDNMIYFPMTYYGSRFMGVETTYSVTDGIGVHQNGVRWSWHGYKRYLPNGKTGTAIIHTGPVQVNNQPVHHSAESYPILLFRDITYFPMTEHYVMDEFGWKYSYSKVDGVSIDSPGTVTAKEIGLPIKTYKDGAGAFVKAGEYYYYEGQRGEIWQASVNHPKKARCVYQLPLQQEPLDDNRYCRPTLHVENNTVLLMFTQMQLGQEQQHYIQILPDGKWQEIYRGSGQVYCYADLMVLHEYQNDAGPGSLQMKRPMERTFVPVSDTPFCCAGSLVFRSGNELLILGSLGEEVSDAAKNPCLLAVNYKSGSVRKLTDETITYFAVENNIVYYLNEAQQLYRLPLTGGTAELVSSVPVKQFVVLDNTICYAHGTTGELWVMGSSDVLNPGGIVTDMEVQEDFFVVDFADNSQSAYTTMILNRKGKILFKTTEHTAGMMIEDGKVSFLKLRK